MIRILIFQGILVFILGCNLTPSPENNKGPVQTEASIAADFQKKEDEKTERERARQEKQKEKERLARLAREEKAKKKAALEAEAIEREKAEAKARELERLAEEKAAKEKAEKDKAEKEAIAKEKAEKDLADRRRFYIQILQAREKAIDEAKLRFPDKDTQSQRDAHVKLRMFQFASKLGISQERLTAIETEGVNENWPKK